MSEIYTPRRGGIDCSRVPDTTGVPPDQSLATVALPRVTDEEACRQGWWAYEFGVHVAQNPYPHSSKQFVIWRDGWREASEDCEG